MSFQLSWYRKMCLLLDQNDSPYQKAVPYFSNHQPPLLYSHCALHCEFLFLCIHCSVNLLSCVYYFVYSLSHALLTLLCIYIHVVSCTVQLHHGPGETTYTHSLALQRNDRKISLDLNQSKQLIWSQQACQCHYQLQLLSLTEPPNLISDLNIK